MGLLLAVMCVAACGADATLDRGAPVAVEQTDRDAQDTLARLFPDALRWYESTEQELLPLGRPLTPLETAQARHLGLAAPEQVRVVTLNVFPLPRSEPLRSESERLGLGTRFEAGRTMGNVIMLKPEWAADRVLMTHELVHVVQQERLGRIRFLRQILLDLATVGYERSPLEVEAYARQHTGWPTIEEPR